MNNDNNISFRLRNFSKEVSCDKAEACGKFCPYKIKYLNDHYAQSITKFEEYTKEYKKSN